MLAKNVIFHFINDKLAKLKVVCTREGGCSAAYGLCRLKFLSEPQLET